MYVAYFTVDKLVTRNSLSDNELLMGLRYKSNIANSLLIGSPSNFQTPPRFTWFAKALIWPTVTFHHHPGWLRTIQFPKHVVSLHPISLRSRSGGPGFIWIHFLGQNKDSLSVSSKKKMEMKAYALMHDNVFWWWLFIILLMITTCISFYGACYLYDAYILHN